ncbi:hypothetical protein Sgou_18900 [Streptomyces gougerotii]|uniref:Uncharacterized protein n=1 Tax=Streptomyces gougerotii TaxID=53448 RepID=A0ABQ1D3W3_9ACTN|nr:DUF5994 family protein [Streptomyces gougerotii]GFH77220.1 hypothetical protein Sgou_18900 [Streptomyces gougerotii]
MRGDLHAQGRPGGEPARPGGRVGPGVPLGADVEVRVCHGVRTFHEAGARPAPASWKVRTPWHTATSTSAPRRDTGAHPATGGGPFAAGPTLRVEVTPHREGLFDGAWWPHSHRATVELPRLVSGLAGLGPGDRGSGWTWRRGGRCRRG